eukprot:TRINITY_DN515_c0_g1_i2.p1 TRINITY_DN515_c0_g1~~TRINITY_DN515_c0_g1_i2.p1  ORF type:complete len:266 (-),score=49.35 TRINITY_DN515_c0_g1_i2:388-1185(-)
MNILDKLPGIIYSLVARNTVVLVEYSTHEGNFSTLAKRILLSIKTHDHKRTYTDKSGRFVFHYMVLDNLTYLCFATKGHKKAVCFAYLNEIYSRFVVAYSEKQIIQAISYSRSFIEFQKILEREMKRYSQLEYIPEPPKFSDNESFSPTLSHTPNNQITKDHYIEMEEMNNDPLNDPNDHKMNVNNNINYNNRSNRSSTISLLMQNNEAVVDNERLERHKMSGAYSEPLLVKKNDLTYSDKKIRSRCFWFSIFFLSLLLIIWLSK